MRPAHGGPRLLLRRLREIMAEPIGPQARLDKVVVEIARNVVAEVCSLYVARADGALELFATEGLRPDAVHITALAPGEGLVGVVAAQAEPLAIQDPEAHPAYSYRPETGEEAYQSFLGVPVLRAGELLGVLVVQNRTRRAYAEDEVEALLTVAMVLAETLASREVQQVASPGATIAGRRSLSVEGTPLSEGVGLGHVVLHDPRVVVRTVVADDPAAERERLDAAIGAMRASVDALIARGDVTHLGEHREVLETFRLFAHDEGWLRRLREAIATGLTAEAAVERVQSDARARMLRQTDPYLRDRLHDLDELANRLLAELVGESFARPGEAMPDNAILVARTMGPAALLDYDRAKLRGLVLEEGGAGSHIAIVARALGVPAVGAADSITSLVESGDAIIVDGGAGDVHLRPRPDVEAAYADKARLRARRQARYRRLREVAPLTADGQPFTLQLNAGLVVDLANLDETGAAGIGLFRTELQFMVASRLPTPAQQEVLYRRVLDHAGDRPVTFRTLDVGGDKVLPYLKRPDEDNPALGWRAIRIGLDRPGLLRAQFRALLRAAGGRSLRVMVPMAATVDEVDRARALLERERDTLERAGAPGPSKLAFGAMVEVPSLLFQLDGLLARVEFVSVGTNDLLQFLFAADRDNPLVHGRFDPLSPAALRALDGLARACAEAGVPVTVCGEIAAKPLEASVLVALGFRDLSLSPAALGPVKEALLALDAAALRAKLLPLLAAPAAAASLRPEIAAHLRARTGERAPA